MGDTSAMASCGVITTPGNSALTWAAKIWRLAAVGGALMLLTMGGAAACAICLSYLQITTSQKLKWSADIVLGVPGAKDQFQIVAVVKGRSVVGDLITITDPIPLDESASTKPLLLLRNERNQAWSGLGAIGTEYVDWLRQVAASGINDGRLPAFALSKAAASRFGLTDAEWHDRVALVLPYLESSNPLAADIAHGELARAPYSALRPIRGLLEATKVLNWIDSAPRSRRSAYILLLGIVGGETEAVRLEDRIDAAWKAGDASDLSAMLAADLELRGTSRVDWVERKYFVDHNRTLPEVMAALQALSVHGEAGGTISRARIIEAYRRFIKERAPMAGFVAEDLADWQYWGAAPDYAKLLKQDVIQDPASHFAVVNYLQRSQRAAANIETRSAVDRTR